MRVLDCCCWLVAALLPSLGAAEQDRGLPDEGMWEFEIDYRMPGMAQPSRPYTTSRCLSRADPLPSVVRSGQNCRPSSPNVRDGVVTWTLDCSTEAERVTGEGRMLYERNRGRGQVHMTITAHGAPPPPYEIQYRLRGERIGRCH